MTNPIDRRAILRGGAAGLFLGGFSASFGRRALASAPVGGLPPLYDPPYDGPSKVLRIFLRGGNDGLNTILPLGDLEFTDPLLRPTIEIGQTDAIDLGNGFAWAHPALEPILGTTAPQDLRDHLASIHRVGYANHSRSHFESQLYMETTIHTADLVGTGVVAGANDGHVPRAAYHLGWSDPTAGKPAGALSVSGQPQTTFNGQVNTYTPVTLDSIAGYKVISGPSAQAPYDKLLATGTGSGLDGSYQPANPPKPHWDPAVRSSGRALLGTLDQIGGISSGSPPATWPGTSTVMYPQSPADLVGTDLQVDGQVFDFAQKVRDAMLLLRQPWCHIAGVELGGFDTHGNQGNGEPGGEHYQVLRILAHMLRSAYHDANASYGGQAPFFGNLVVVVQSEFGRTSEENGSKGTDHGHAGVAFLMGGRVNGGVKNCDAASWVPVNAGSTSVIHEYPLNAGAGTPTYPGHLVDYRTIEVEILSKMFGITHRPTVDEIIFDYENQVGALPQGFIS